MSIPDSYYEQLAKDLLAQQGAPQMSKADRDAFPLLLRSGLVGSVLPGTDLSEYAEHNLRQRAQPERSLHNMIPYLLPDLPQPGPPHRKYVKLRTGQLVPNPAHKGPQNIAVKPENGISIQTAKIARKPI